MKTFLNISSIILFLFCRNYSAQTNTLYFFDEKYGWAILNNNALYSTTNGGSYWGNIFKFNFRVRTFLFTSPTDGWLIREPFQSDPSQLYSTTDGGKTWNEVKIFPNHFFSNIFFLNKSTSLLFTQPLNKMGKIFRTTDSWNSSVNVFESTNDVPGRKIFFVDPQNGWVLGELMIIRTKDSGITWDILPLRANPISGMGATRFEGIQMFNKTSGILAMSTEIEVPYGSLYLTEDEGVNWKRYGGSTTFRFGITNLYFTNKDTGWVFSAGSGGIICYTTNAAARWDTLQTGINNFVFVSKNKSWGHGGDKIYFSNDGWKTRQLQLLTNVEEEYLLPENFSLSQNYPNPFNPTTKIKFSIPAVETRRGESLQHVTLKVFNILGNEIATLVNEEKLPGNYEVTVNGNNLASGVYFYRLTTKNIILSKKMILIK